MAQTARIQVPEKGILTCSSTAEEAVDYLRQVLAEPEPWHGLKLLSCGPKKLAAGDLLHDFNDVLTFTNYSHLSSGPPISIPRTDVRGITIAQLLRLLDFVEKRASTWYETYPVLPHYGQPLSFECFNMYHANDWVVRPATASPFNCSYVELVASDVASERPLWFVSHAWLEPLHNVMACLRGHASLRELMSRPDHTAYWVDVLANNQHDLTAEILDNPRKTSFCLALKRCAGLLLILDQDCVTLTRIWTCFEVSLAVEERNLSLEAEKRNKGKSGNRFLLDVAAMDCHGKAYLITDGLVGAEERMQGAFGFHGQRPRNFMLILS